MSFKADGSLDIVDMPSGGGTGTTEMITARLRSTAGQTIDGASNLAIPMESTGLGINRNQSQYNCK